MLERRPRPDVRRRRRKKAIELGGKFDGHELPEDINAFTKASATALAGQGLMGVAKDTYPRDGNTHSFVVGFAEVEVDVETGACHDRRVHRGRPTSARSSTRAACGGQTVRRLDARHRPRASRQKWVYDQQYGVALARRFHHNKPPTILDIPADDARSTRSTSPIPRRRWARAASANRRWAPAAARWRRRSSTRSATRRSAATPVTPDLLLTSIEAQDLAARRAHGAHLREHRIMAVIHDMMPAFELFQPASLDDALGLLDQARQRRLVLAGGLDSMDWLKDRIRGRATWSTSAASRGCAASRRATASRSAP